MLRTGERAANIRKLIELRDQDANANAAVKATMALIEMDDAGDERTGDASPGIQIIIGTGTEPRGLTIDHRPVLPDPTVPTRPSGYVLEPPAPPPPPPVFRVPRR